MAIMNSDGGPRERVVNRDGIAVQKAPWAHGEFAYGLELAAQQAVPDVLTKVFGKVCSSVAF